jgi:outer membrane immunogenic protein
MRAVFNLGIAALASLTVPVAAIAADVTLPPRAPAPVYVAPPFSWTGFYLGGNFGGTWASTTLTDNLTGASLTASRSGWLDGGQAGFNYQTGNFVWGVEATFDWTSLNTTGTPFATAFGPLQASANTQWLTTLAARLGYAADRWLVYGKAGGGWVSNSATVTNVTSQVSATTSNATSGWLVGAGLEFGFTPNWSAKLEYDYLGLSGWTAASPLIADTVTVKRQLNMITTGVNYRFGW